MKKTFTLFIAFVLIFSIRAQNIFVQDFSAGIMPPSSWTLSGQNSNWKIKNSANAGGVAPEGNLNWSPQFNTMSRLISPAYDLSGNTKAIFKFKQMMDHYSGSYQVGVATRASASDEWTNAWAQNYSTGIPASEKIIIIENEDVNSSTFQLCLFFNGSSYNINDWYFDDLTLFIPVDNDAELSSVDVPDYFIGERVIKGLVSNMGLEILTSYDINWSLDNGEVHTTSYNGLNIDLGSSHNFECTQIINPDPGTHDLKIWVSNVNGGEDDNPDNNLIQKEIGVASQSVQRKPFFEEFTSSTCAPCASFNNSVFNPFIAQHGDEITLIKYQMNWPGAGDPYYTAEGGVRRTYYGVNAVPVLFVEGKNVSTSAVAINNAFNAAMANPAFVNISATHQVNETDFTANVQILPYVSLNQVTVHVVFIEKLTTGNVASNGETSFHHVMMKMMPDANGTTMDLAGGEVTTLSFTQDMSTTNVEEMEDLVAVVFIQDNSDKNIFQAAYSVEGQGGTAAVLTIDPADGTVDFPTEADLHISYDMPVFMLGGEPLTNENISDFISLHEVDGADFPFEATINMEKTEIIVSPVGLLDKQTTYEFGIGTVQNAAGVMTPGANVTFTTGFHVGINDQKAEFTCIAPNPVRNQLSIDYLLNAASSVRIDLYDLNGRKAAEIESGSKVAGMHHLNWNTTEMPSGIYMLRLQSNQNVITSKVIISK